MPSGSPMDTIKVAFGEYFNDKTIAFNNQIITCLLLLSIYTWL